MKTGYSLLLREYIWPVKVEYQDCRTYQIVCPECKEPVFKVQRQINETEVNFFSHYRRDETLNAQCELRVNSITSTRMNEIRTESRNQKLALFLKVFQDLIWRNEYTEKDLPNTRNRFYKLNQSPAFVQWRSVQMDAHRRMVTDKSEINAWMNESLENLYTDEKEYQTLFSKEIQKEFAYDFFEHILSGNVKSNNFFLNNHSYIKAMDSLANKTQTYESEIWEDDLLEAMIKILNARNLRKGVKIFEQMASYSVVSPYTQNREDMLIMFGSLLVYHAFGILLRLPYLKILKPKAIE